MLQYADCIGYIYSRGINQRFNFRDDRSSSKHAETVEDVVSFATTDGKKQIKTRRLGPVGGRIVAETFVGLLLGDSSSYLAQDPLWTPDPALMENGHFGLREFIKFASA